MPKKRKTRKEKILLDHKKQAAPVEVKPMTPSAATEAPQTQELPSGTTFTLPATQHKTAEKQAISKPSSQTITVNQNEYTYLSNDLMRTALLTCAIVFAELFIKLFIVH